MPWYWIVIIISAVVGPFETYWVVSKALQRKREREKKAKADAEEKRKT